MKKTTYCKISLVTLTALITTACSAAVTSSPTPSPALTTTPVADASAARDAALIYLGKNYQNIMTDNITWNEQNVNPSGLVGVDSKYFTSSNWEANISYPVVLPENKVYTIVISNPEQGLFWKGEVRANGTINEISPLQQVTQDESRQIADELVKKSPTYIFDGMAETFKYVETAALATPNTWRFTFQFESKHAGYGDRTGQMLAELITPHKINITVENGKIISALMDEVWDMLSQKMVNDTTDNPDTGVSPRDDGTQSTAVEFSYDDLLNRKHITREIALASPGSLIVTLSSNPSTAFQWQDAQIGNSIVISEYSHQFVEPQNGLIGAAGKEVWVFKPLNKGTSEIQFQYSRPWDGGEQAEWTVKLTVIVK